MVTQTTVSTDAQDYAPGSWAEITATGFDPGSIVIFQVQHAVDPGADGSWGTLDDVIVDLGGEGHEAWGVEDGGNLDLDGAANGTVVTPWYVNPDDSLNWHFLLTATDSAGQTVSAGFTDSLPGAASLDLTTSGNTGEINGALFSNVVYAAGTGLIDPFVRIQQNGSEQGYNSSADLSQQFNETAKYNTAYNKALSLGDIPVVYIYNPDTGDFSAYRQILLDINENRGGGQQYLSLDALQIYQSDSATLSAFTGSYTTTGSFTGGSSSLIYNLDANGDHWLALDFELNAGSGVGDVAVYIPDTYFTDDQFVYLYSAFGWQAESPGYKWESSDGFEEWSVSQQGLLSVSQIVGAKFIDSDQDGSWDTGESAQADVQIYLDQDLDGMLDWVDQNDNDVWDIGEGERWTTTDADGAYVFDNLAAGLGIYSTYYVREVVPEDYSQTAPGDGAYSVGVGSETATVSDGVITVVIATADEVYALPAFGNHLDFIPAPSLTIEKVVDQAEISAPGTLHYTITVTNTGNVDLTTVDLTDDLAGDEELISGDEGNDGILGVGEVWVYGATYAVTQDDINAGEDLVNVATVDTDQTEPLSDDAVTGVLWEPSLTIEKVVDQAEISAPGTLHYTITVTNTGNVDLTTVDLTDDLAGDEELISGDEGNDGILGVGEVWVYGATYAVTQDDINAGEDLVNVATVDTDQTQPLSDDATTSIKQLPSSLIAPTNTTVQQYLDGSALTFQEYYDYQGGVIQYSASLKTGKITQTNPGVFFYYTGASGEIKATDGTELIVTIDQTLDPADSPMSAFKTLQKNIVLYRVGDANGNGIYDTGDTLSKESSYSLGTTDSDVTLTFTAKADSFYVVSVKYETNSIVGTVVGKDSSAWPTINYQFDTWLTIGSDSAEMIETYAGGVDLAPKKLTPMLLDGDQGSGARSVNEAQIKHVINAAICWWEAQGISDEQLAKLKTTTVEITDLAEQSDEDHSWMLGVQNGESLITIDDDAADHGWSLGLGGVAHDKVDLLSVLVHEMGHVLGKTDEDMGASLGVGERMLPELSTTPPDDDQVDEDPDIPSIPTVAHMLTLVGSEAAAQQMQLHMSGLSA